MENKIKVVVADDIEVLAKNMESIIAENPRVDNVYVALNGEEAIEGIMNLDADMVFTDMQMPKKTGIEVIETILEDPCVKKKPQFILVTADRDSSLIVKANELGFDIEYKPINPNRIYEYIDNYESVKINTESEERKTRKEIEENKNELKKEGFFSKWLNSRKKEV